MSYGLFNWWWGEDAEDYLLRSDWSWLIDRLNKIVEGTSTDYQDYVLTIVNPSGQNIGSLDFRYLPLADDVKGISLSEMNWATYFTNSASELVPSGETPLTMAERFKEMMNQYPEFYTEIIKKGNPFLFIPASENYPLANWLRGDNLRNQLTNDEQKVFKLMDSIIRPSWQGDGYVCINPEANRIITKYLSNVWTDGFEQVADYAGWGYPHWYNE